MFFPSLQDIFSSIRYLQKACYVPGTALGAGEQQRIKAHIPLGGKVQSL